MASTPFVIERFGGLNVLDDPLEVGASGAVSMVNVDLDHRGVVRCRDGLTSWSTYVQPTPSSNPFYRLWEAHNGHRLASSGSTTYALSLVGGLVTSSAFLASGIGAHANYATPTASYTFIARTGAAVPMRYDGAAFAAPAYAGTSPTGQFLAVTAKSNRLVNFGISGNPDRILFSDAGDPLTFTAANFVDVGWGGLSTPYAAARWQNELYIFSSQQVYVFGDESTDSSGNPIFGYRTIDTPYGETVMAPPVVAPDGVYVLSNDGLYRTQGGPFTLVSDAINPLLQGLLSPSFTLSSTGTEVACVNHRLYFAVFSSTLFDYVLVYDLKLQTWLIWNVAIFGLGVSHNNRVPRLYVSLRTGTSPNPIAYFDPAATTDNGTAISWSWQTGKYSLADPGKVAVTDYSALTGSGTVTLTIDSDKYTGQSASATLGVAPAIAEGFPSPLDNEGKWFQSTLSGTGAASVNRLRHNVASIRPGD